MGSQLLRCGNCQDLLDTTVFAEPESCPRCGTVQVVHAFPSLCEGPLQGRFGDPLVEGDSSCCFYHADRRAEVPCDQCGRFLCALCDVDAAGAHYCPECLEKGAQTGSLPFMRNSVFRYDLLALMLACIPFFLAVPLCAILLPIEPTAALGVVGGLFIFPSIITAPAALFIGIWYRNAPVSAVTRRKFWFMLARIIALLQLVIWIIALVSFIFIILQG